MASRGWAVRGQRLAGVVLVIGATTIFGVGVSAASQGGDDHQVTICHRTNAENNPYVEITVDKASIFKQGHDTHDEGGVHQPGDKANDIRWGDIIPAFDYYASPKDQSDGNVSHYGGLNIADGQTILDNGCEVPDEEAPEPAGALFGECDDDAFEVSGVVDDDGAEDVEFRLSLSDGSTIAVNEDSFEETLTADPGTKVTLQAMVGQADWTDIDGPVTVTECEEEEESPPPSSSSAPETSVSSSPPPSESVGVLPTKVENTTAEESPSPETSVQGEKLPHTGGGLPYVALIVLSVGLLLAGGSLIMLPGLAIERPNRRH